MSGRREVVLLADPPREVEVVSDSDSDVSRSLSGSDRYSCRDRSDRWIW